MLAERVVRYTVSPVTALKLLRTGSVEVVQKATSLHRLLRRAKNGPE